MTWWGQPVFNQSKTFTFFLNKKISHLIGECRHQIGVREEFKRGVDVAYPDWVCVREGTPLLGECPLHPYCYIDILALCTGMRPVIMIDYGGKMPELRDRLCAFLKFSQEESCIFENIRVMVIEDMIYLIHVRELAELIKLTINKELELHFVDLEQDPPKMVTEVEKISVGAQFISLQKLFFSVFCDDATADDVSDCRLLVNNQPSDFIDLSRFMQDTPVTLPTLNGWLLGYPVVYIFGKDHIQDAVYNLSTKSLNLFHIFVRRNGSSSKRPPQEELMRSDFKVLWSLSYSNFFLYFLLHFVLFLLMFYIRNVL
ncbi:hypothetical protein Hanom_Chr11g01037721 [Helianthus anomalus]